MRTWAALHRRPAALCASNTQCGCAWRRPRSHGCRHCERLQRCRKLASTRQRLFVPCQLRTQTKVPKREEPRFQSAAFSTRCDRNWTGLDIAMQCSHPRTWLAGPVVKVDAAAARGATSLPCLLAARTLAHLARAAVPSCCSVSRSHKHSASAACYGITPCHKISLPAAQCPLHWAAPASPDFVRTAWAPLSR